MSVDETRAVGGYMGELVDFCMVNNVESKVVVVGDFKNVVGWRALQRCHLLGCGCDVTGHVQVYL